MKFFIPHTQVSGQIDLPDEAEAIYQGVIKFAEANMQPRKISPERIYSIETEVDGRGCILKVGDSKIFGEKVVAILLAEDIYLVCTENRGVLREAPAFFGERKVKNVVLFDP